ncbi:unnamed protein product [Sphagnum tenellum]
MPQILFNSSTGFLINSTTPVSFTVPSVFIPDRVPVIFGDASRKIESDGDTLFITAQNMISLESTTVRIVGNLVVSKTSTFTVETETTFDSGVITLGGGESDTITDIESTLSATSSPPSTIITLSKNHNLLLGDSVTLVDTNPDIDGTYTVSSETNDTASARTGFFGFDRSTERFTYIPEATRTNDVFTGEIGDFEMGTLYASSISASNLISSLNTGGNLVTGSNFTISGGMIDNVPIGSVQPSTGTFTDLHVLGVNGSLETSSDITFSNGVFSVPSISGFALAGNVDLAQYSLSNGTIDSSALSRSSIDTSSFSNGTIDNTAATALSVSQSTIDSTGFSNGKHFSGEAKIDISGNSETVTDGLYRHDFSADNTILKADTAGNPEILQVDEETLIGRQTGSVITDLSVSTVQDMLDIVQKTLYTDNSILIANTASDPTALTIPPDTIIGRLSDASTPIAALTPEQIVEMIITTDVLYRYGALLRDGHLTYPDGGKMTGLIYYSTERFSLTTGQTMDLDLNVETSYVTVNYSRAGGKVAYLNLGRGFADGHRKEVDVMYLLVIKFATRIGFQTWDSKVNGLPRHFRLRRPRNGERVADSVYLGVVLWQCSKSLIHRGADF